MMKWADTLRERGVHSDELGRHFNRKEKKKHVAKHDMFKFNVDWKKRRRMN